MDSTSVRYEKKKEHIQLKQSILEQKSKFLFVFCSKFSYLCSMIMDIEHIHFSVIYKQALCPWCYHCSFVSPKISRHRLSTLQPPFLCQVRIRGAVPHRHETPQVCRTKRVRQDAPSSYATRLCHRCCPHRHRWAHRRVSSR